MEDGDFFSNFVKDIFKSLDVQTCIKTALPILWSWSKFRLIRGVSICLPIWFLFYHIWSCLKSTTLISPFVPISYMILTTIWQAIFSNELICLGSFFSQITVRKRGLRFVEFSPIDAFYHIAFLHLSRLVFEKFFHVIDPYGTTFLFLNLIVIDRFVPPKEFPTWLFFSSCLLSPWIVGGLGILGIPSPSLLFLFFTVVILILTTNTFKQILADIASCLFPLEIPLSQSVRISHFPRILYLLFVVFCYILLSVVLKRQISQRILVTFLNSFSLIFQSHKALQSINQEKASKILGRIMKHIISPDSVNGILWYHLVQFIDALWIFFQFLLCVFLCIANWNPPYVLLLFWSFANLLLLFVSVMAELLLQSGVFGEKTPKPLLVHAEIKTTTPIFWIYTFREKLVEHYRMYRKEKLTKLTTKNKPQNDHKKPTLHIKARDRRNMRKALRIRKAD